MSDWQPIETAPKDGTWILVSGGEINYGWEGRDYPPCVVAQYLPHCDGWQFAWYDGGYYGAYESPTHWAPLPAPPDNQ